MTTKRPIILAAFTVIVLPNLCMARQQQQPIRVVVDGSAINFRDQQPTKTNNRVLVPLRGIFERLGADVHWEPSTQTVTARKGRITIQLGIGQLDASIDGRDVHLDVPASLVGGSTMVPLRFVSEALGATVTWNDQEQEADITPAREHDHREEHIRPPVAAPPPAQVLRRPPPPVLWQLPPPVQMDVILPDTVIPFTLNTRLSSFNARTGDLFVGTLQTSNQSRYLDLPAGTQVAGSVGYVRRQHGNDPGVIELRMDHLTTPAGHTIPINGRVFALDDKRIGRGQRGEYIAQGVPRYDRAVFAGYGGGSGVVVGFSTGSRLEDASIGMLLGSTVDRARKARKASDVELTPGTQFGVRLHQQIVVSHDLH